MHRFAASLIGGPQWQTRTPRRPSGLLMSLPLLLLLAAIILATIIGAASQALQPALNALPPAAAATLLCLAVAIPAAATPATLVRPGPGWMLPLWLSFSAGPAAWSLLDGTPAWLAFRIAGLLLPLMVICLAGAWARLPPLWQSAACAGAGSWRILFAVMLPCTLPGMLRACLIVLPLAWAAALRAHP